MTPIIHTPILPSSYLVIISPRNKNAIMVAKIGEVFCRNASFDNEMSLTAELNRKNVIVPDIALIITSFHY